MRYFSNVFSAMDQGEVLSPSDEQLDFDDDTLRGKKINSK